MKVMWIGHGGLLFVSGKTKVVIDPYLSNSLRDTDASFKRKMGIKKKLLKIKPDAIILTSSHPDRCDPKTVTAYVKKRKFLFFPIKVKHKVDVLCSQTVFKAHSKAWTKMNANPVMFGADLEWSVGNLVIKGVSAKTDDTSAFGLIITDITDGKKYYIASNTLYSDKLFNKLPDDLFAAFIPVGGMFGSMNIIDATRFARRLNAQFSIPVLFGMFDKKQKADDFVVPGRIIPKIYKIIQFTMFPVNSIFSSGLDMFFNEKNKKKINLDDFDDIDNMDEDNIAPDKEPESVPAIAENSDVPEEVPVANNSETPVSDENPDDNGEAPVNEESPDDNGEAPVSDEIIDDNGEAPVSEENPDDNGEAPVSDETPDDNGETPVNEENPDDNDESPVSEENLDDNGEAPVSEENPDDNGEAPVSEEIPNDVSKIDTDDE